ncbi:hypothetical protein [Sabulibacter ruber]|uniref:hypothetical protein n=1 Tax=Sabulibacter ruber TaxID=2811901 RepID=UPI001A979F68|nr:hypothetical protein [Sabulibacter ruber]
MRKEITRVSSRVETFIVFALSFFIIYGNAYLIMVNHDPNFAGDEKSYLSMGNGNWDVSVIHRYRIVVPVLARGVAFLIQLTGAALGREMDSLPLGMSFFLVNSTLMAISGMVIYKVAKLMNVSDASACIAMLSVITSGYCTYFSGLALVDSFYFLVVTLLFYSVLAENKLSLFCCVVLGPLAKESFWLFIPFVFIFCRFFSFYKVLFCLVISIVLFVLVNYAVDYFFGLPASPRVIGAVSHLDKLLINLKRIFTINGFLAWFSAFGFFNLLIVAGLVLKVISIRFSSRIAMMQLVFLGIVLAHVLISGDIGRMWYLAAPALGLSIALSAERLIMPAFRSTRNQQNIEY